MKDEAEGGSAGQELHGSGGVDPLQRDAVPGYGRAKGRLREHEDLEGRCEAAATCLGAYHIGYHWTCPRLAAWRSLPRCCATAIEDLVLGSLG